MRHPHLSGSQIARLALTLSVLGLMAVLASTQSRAAGTPTPVADTPSPIVGPPPGSTSVIVSISGIEGHFYKNSAVNNGSYNIVSSASPLWTERFPVIDFDPPPAGQLSCSNSTGIDQTTHPFTDLVAQSDGTCAALVAQGNGLQAGVGALQSFEAWFSGNLDVAQAGDITFDFYADDGWILGMGTDANGDQPTYVDGARDNAPSSGVSPMQGYKVVGAYNHFSVPTGTKVTVHFPNRGTYPMELDYTECCDGKTVLVLAALGSIPPGTTTAPSPTPYVVKGAVSPTPASSPTPATPTVKPTPSEKPTPKPTHGSGPGPSPTPTRCTGSGCGGGIPGWVWGLIALAALAVAALAGVLIFRRTGPIPFPPGATIRVGGPAGTPNGLRERQTIAGKGAAVPLGGHDKGAVTLTHFPQHAVALVRPGGRKTNAIDIQSTGRVDVFVNGQNRVPTNDPKLDPEKRWMSINPGARITAGPEVMVYSREGAVQRGTPKS